MKEHRHILELAARKELPEQIDEQSEISVEVLRELIEAGYLKAIDTSSFDGEAYIGPKITLPGREYLRKLQSDVNEAERELIQILERMRDIMIAVSTGEPRINEMNDKYRQLYSEAEIELKKRGLIHNNPFPDLWDWYGRWSSGDLSSYQSRRQFVSEIFNPILEQLRQYISGQQPVLLEPTGWPKVDRTIGEIRKRLAEAENEEQFQAVGLLCREALISLAQAVHDPKKHPSIDGKKPSETDAKRMLEAYLLAEFSGSTNEVARRYAKSAYKLAVELQHRRTAGFRHAALCVDATSSLINVIAIVSGRRDPVNT
jgi:hypothetical protein